MAPEHMDVVVAPESFERSGSITGPIFVRHGPRDAAPDYFPERDWIDFPVVILGWWLVELGRLAAGTASDATCAFMDGPFQMLVTPTDGTLWRVRCVRGFLEDGAEPLADFLVPAQELMGSVRGAVSSALAECERRGWSDRDIDALREGLRASRGA